MINYSAFPVRKSSVRAWWVIPTVLILTSFFTSVVLIALPDEQTRMHGLRLFQNTVYFVSVVGGLIIFVLPIWFIWKILIPRIHNRLTGDYDAEVISPNFIDINAQFAKDNGFVFKEYTYRAPALQDLYKDLIKKNVTDDISILYEITGTYAGTNLRFYCISLATNQNRALKDGMAYAYQTDGRYVEYTTILKVSVTKSVNVKSPIKVLNSDDATYIYTHGYVNDRDTIMKIFRGLE